MINLIVIVSLLTLPFAVEAAEGLTEMESRKARITAGQHTYSADALEDPTTYVWQPETLQYNDTTTGNEVWVLIRPPDRQALWSKEYATAAWSFDGSTMGAFVEPSDKTSNNPDFVDSGTYKRWLVKTDGSMLKAATGYANEGISEGGFGWAHTENVYYGVGAHASWDADPGMLVKNTVDDSNNVTGAELLQLNSANTALGYSATTFGLVKRPISPDDNWITLSSRTEMDRGTTIDCIGQMRVALNKGSSVSVEDYWGVNRDIHEYFDHVLASEAGLHGGGNWAWGFDNEYSHFLYDSPDHIFFQLKSTGSASDGGPLWEDWDGDSYGDDEIDVMTYGDDSRTGDAVPAGGYGHQYWNHPSFDMWNKYVLTGLGDTTGASNELVGPGIAIRDVSAGTEYIELANDLSTNGQYDGNHKAWNGWTDEIIMFPAYIGDDHSGQETMHARRVNFDTQTKDDVRAIVTTHLDGETRYNSLPRPSQSPDGTKVAFSNYFLSNSVDDPYISFVVSHYPYPPEITSLTGTGTYTIRFDYRLDQATPRGYSTRGWPTDSDDAPVPREIESFRLRRSTDNSTWTPIRTVSANITTKFDLSDGGLNDGQVGYWEMSDSPGAGTYYYAVTGIETSGLESRVLSNVYSTAGSQATAYPADPGADTGITTTTDTDLVRYYDIHVADGSTPTIGPSTKIASVPASVTGFVDWLGSLTGNSEYLVVPVTTQGDSLDTITPTVSYQSAPATADGQYTLAWVDEDSVAISASAVKMGGDYYKIN